jgi:hypothetical protein
MEFEKEQLFKYYFLYIKDYDTMKRNTSSIHVRFSDKAVLILLDHQDSCDKHAYELFLF